MNSRTKPFDPETQRRWTGGSYPEQNGMLVTAKPDGIEIEGWYEKWGDLHVEAFIPWTDLDTLREAAQKEHAA